MPARPMSAAAGRPAMPPPTTTTGNWALGTRDWIVMPTSRSKAQKGYSAAPGVGGPTSGEPVARVVNGLASEVIVRLGGERHHSGMPKDNPDDYATLPWLCGTAVTVGGLTWAIGAGVIVLNRWYLAVVTSAFLSGAMMPAAVTVCSPTVDLASGAQSIAATNSDDDIAAVPVGAPLPSPECAR